MAKKPTGIASVAIMMFIVCLITACGGENLADYKTTKTAEIVAYATSKGQANYTIANWAKVDAAVESGKTAVGAAESKTQVDTAVSATKDAVDMVSRKLKGRLESDGGEPAPPIWTEFTSDESRLKIGEDLTIEFYYDFPAWHLIPGEHPNDTFVGKTSAKISMGHGVYTKRLIQKGEHTHSQPEYTFVYESVEEFVLKETDDFEVEERPHAELPPANETIIIPSNWFVGEMGSIVWSVEVHIIGTLSRESLGSWYDVGVDKTYGSGVALYYRIEGENIILFNSYYKFFNDIRN